MYLVSDLLQLLYTTIRWAELGDNDSETDDQTDDNDDDVNGDLCDFSAN